MASVRSAVGPAVRRCRAWTAGGSSAWTIDGSLTSARVCADACSRRSLAAVAVDHYAFVLTDPETTVGCHPARRGPDLERPAAVIRLKYLSQARPVDHPGRQPGCTTLCTSATRRRPGRSAVAGRPAPEHGVTDVLLAVLRDRHGTWGFLDLWRHGGVFRADEVAAVSAALPR